MKTLPPVSRRNFLISTLKTSCWGCAASGVFFSTGFLFPSCSKESNWKIGCFTRPWDEYDYRIALDAIAEAGFKYAGLMTTKSESRLVISTATSVDEALTIGEQVKQRGLKILSVYGGQFGADESLQKGMEGLKILIDNCAACESESLLLAGTGKKEVFDNYYQTVKDSGDYAVEKGVKLTLKPHGGLNATGPQCRDIVTRVNHKNLTLWYDPGNIFYYSDGVIDPVQDAPSVNGLVSGMCVKDFLAPKNVLVTPGSGEVNFPEVLKRLIQGGFGAGPLLVECLKPGSLPEILDEAKKARRFLEGIIAEV